VGFHVAAGYPVEIRGSNRSADDGINLPGCHAMSTGKSYRRVGAAYCLQLQWAPVTAIL
jgi:hypothetical protein